MNEADRKREAERIAGQRDLYIREALIRLEHAINATPTGKARNALCEAQISVMQAIDILRS